MAIAEALRPMPPTPCNRKYQNGTPQVVDGKRTHTTCHFGRGQNDKFWVAYCGFSETPVSRLGRLWGSSVDVPGAARNHLKLLRGSDLGPSRAHTACHFWRRQNDKYWVPVFGSWSLS